jgi:hypothetical protein
VARSIDVVAAVKAQRGCRRGRRRAHQAVEFPMGYRAELLADTRNEAADLRFWPRPSAWRSAFCRAAGGAQELGLALAFRSPCPLRWPAA